MKRYFFGWKRAGFSSRRACMADARSRYCNYIFASVEGTQTGVPTRSPFTTGLALGTDEICVVRLKRDQRPLKM